MVLYMKIAIPMEERDLNKQVCFSFGRAPYYAVYDTETEQGSFIENTAASSPGGAGIKAAQLIADGKAAADITPRCGENAANVLKESGVKIYKSAEVSAKENIRFLVEGKLKQLGEIHSGFHGRKGFGN